MLIVIVIVIVRPQVIIVIVINLKRLIVAALRVMLSDVKRKGHQAQATEKCKEDTCTTKSLLCTTVLTQQDRRRSLPISRISYHISWVSC